MEALAKRTWQLETGRRWGCGSKGQMVRVGSSLQPAALAQGGMGRCAQGRWPSIVLENGALVLEME